MSFTITTPSGSRTLPFFAVTSDDQSRQLRIEREDGRRILFGDGLQKVAPLNVDVYVQGATNAETGGEAQRIIDDAKIATSVTTPRGTRQVLDLISHELTTEGRMLIVSLSFAPARGVYI